MSQKFWYLTTVAGFAAALAVSANDATAATVTYRIHNPIGGGEPGITGSNIATYGSVGSALFSLDAISLQLDFSKFDPVLGTLTGVFWKMFQDIESRMTLTNTSNTVQTGSVYTSVSTTLVVPVPLQSNATGTQSSQPFAYSLAGTSGTVVTTGPLFGTHLVATTDEFGDPTFVAASGPLTFSRNSSTGSTLTAFTGTSGNAINEFAHFFATTLTTTTDQSNGGNVTRAQTTGMDIDGYVTYTYNAAAPPSTGVPEPMTAAVLMAGLAGLAGIRRRR